MVFDKTGTLTYGQPEVVRVILLLKEKVFTSRLFMAILGLAEGRSEHPLGEAITRFASRVSYVPGGITNTLPTREPMGPALVEWSSTCRRSNNTLKY